MRGNARRRRARLLLWSALPCLVALAFAAKLLSLNLLAGQAQDAFAKDNPQALAATANWLGTVNWLEPYKAEFAQGDAHVLEGDFAAARVSFEAALANAPAADECKVRVNLVLSTEKLGDARRAAGDDAAANSQYEDGKAVVSAAPGSCFTVGAEGSADGEGERLSKAKDRLASKTAAPRAEESGGGQQAAPVDPETVKQLQQLEQGGRTAQKDRVHGEQRKEYLDGSGAMPAVERPW